MQQQTAATLMIPVKNYASISAAATVLDGIQALEQAQRIETEQDPAHHRDRALLVMDDRGEVVGKLSMWAVIACLAPRFDHVEGNAASSRAASRIGSARTIIESVMRGSHVWRSRVAVVAAKTGRLRVGDLVSAPRDDELIDEHASLEQAAHQLVGGRYLSLLVTSERRIVGVLRLVDVYEAVCVVIKGEGDAVG